jgi:putative iron-only hydrogenase system regulator
MERRIGSVLILLRDRQVSQYVNSIISNHSTIIIARQGLPVRNSDTGIISLILEGTTDQIGSLTGQLGRIQGVEVKSVVLKLKDQDENH